MYQAGKLNTKIKDFYIMNQNKILIKFGIDFIIEYVDLEFHTV